jgi:hypothetical protein
VADAPSHRVDWEAVERTEAARRRHVARERRIGRGMLVAGVALLAAGLALVLAAAGAVEIAGIALVALGAVVAALGNRRLLRLERFRASGGDASPAASAWFTQGWWGGS